MAFAALILSLSPRGAAAMPSGAAGPAPASPALVVMDEGPEAAGRARDRVAVLTGVHVPAERTFDRDRLAEAGGGSVLLEGPIEAYTCKGPALDHAGFAVRLGAAVKSVDALELDKADAALDALRQDLPCAVETLEPRELHDLLFYTGLMAAYHDEREAAIDSFARAVAILADIPWNPAYPPDAQQLHLLGKERLLGAAPARLAVVPPVDARSVWLDGRRQAGVDAAELELKPGMHLLQIEIQGGAQRSYGLVVRSGPSMWADSRAAVSASAAGSDAGLAGRAATALLSRAAERWGAALVYVVSGPAVYEYASGRMFTRARPSAAPTGDRLGIRAGAGLLVRGPTYADAPFAYAAPSVEGELAVFRGIELGARLSLGIARFAEGSTSVLPVGSAGIRQAWPGVSVRPYVGVDGALAVVGEGSVRGGGLARGGLRIQPSRTSPLRIAVDVSGGWVGAPQFGIAVSVGLGVRPTSHAAVR